VIAEVSKYTDVRAVAKAAAPRAPGIIIKQPRKGRVNIRDFINSELRSGKYLNTMLNWEKHLADKRWRQVARERWGEKPNWRSEFQLLARVPSRDYFRWKSEDPDFWKDNSNLKRLRRSNDDLRACIHV
jgi:predicted HNH restriction endonuclease